MIAAHRASFKVFVGDIPDGMFVCHKCDVKACVNPEHLFLGTALENMRDKIAKGRSVYSLGVGNGAAKLTEIDVVDIRANSGTQREIARRYGISQTLVSQIKSHLIWRHI